MKKALSVFICQIFIISAFAITVSAASAPLGGGNVIFTPDKILYAGDAGTMWNNAFCNEDWTGARWTASQQDGIDCVAVVPVTGKTNSYLDFNYYQWNYKEYNPSLDTKNYKYFKVKYKFNSEASSVAEMGFWASKDVFLLGDSAILKTASKKWTITNGYGTWQTAIVSLEDLVFSDNTKCGDVTVRQFRLHPFGGLTRAASSDKAVVYLEYMAFFKTEAEAKRYIGPYEQKKLDAVKTSSAVANTTAKATASSSSKAPQTNDDVIIIYCGMAIMFVSAAVISFTMKKKCYKR